LLGREYNGYAHSDKWARRHEEDGWEDESVAKKKRKTGKRLIKVLGIRIVKATTDEIKRIPVPASHAELEGTTKQSRYRELQDFPFGKFPGVTSVVRGGRADGN
jgi:hypothetical protein